MIAQNLNILVMKILSRLLLILSIVVFASFYSESQSTVINLDFNKINSDVIKLTDEQKSVITLDIPEKGFIDFEVFRNKTISDTYASELPEIGSFDIFNRENNIQGTLTIGDGKVFVSLITKDGFCSIWPKKSGNSIEYTYEKGFGSLKQMPLHCQQDTSFHSREMLNNWKSNFSFRESNSSGEKLKTFKLAIICTGEFYEANGGTSNAVNTLITAIVNGWNVILKKDLSIKLSLVQSFLYTDKNNDPFIPDEAGGKVRTTQAVDAIYAKFSNSSYDIGHVFHNHDPGITSNWSNGGLAGVGVVCNNSTGYGSGSGPAKAAGWSGAYNNDDNDYIQLSIHEVGHQFNMLHTFNGTGESCTDNISETTAYEIGSGTTIMSYNGVCSSNQNIPSMGVADNYFHANSLERAISFIANTNCGTSTTTSNKPPIANAGQDYTIPRYTPFMLTGTATDENNDPMTYVWEEYDEDGAGTSTQGFIGSTAASNSKAPLFRSYPPSDLPVRFFPSKSYILAGQNTSVTFEALPSVARTMKFRFVVRDNNASSGGVAWDEKMLTVNSNSGPFEISTQNTATTLTSTGSETFTMKWNVNNTEKAPVNCSNVDIFYSKDGGKTFPFFLETTPNDGEHTVKIPNYSSTEGRFMAKASNNVFFDINNADIKVISSCAPIGASFTPTSNYKYDYNKSSNPNLDLSLIPAYGKAITKFSGSISTSDKPSNMTYLNKDGNACTVSANEVTYDIFTFYVTVNGKYTFENTGTFGTVMNFYINDYSDNDLCGNMIGTNAYKPVGATSVTIDNAITLDLLAGKKYYFRISSFSPSFPVLPASYNVNLKTKPSGAVMYDNIPSPGNDYIYTFIAYKSTDQKIVAINQSSDFRELLDDFGIYYVKGICVAKKDTNTLKAKIGKEIGSIDTAIYNFTICAEFSSNLITIEIVAPKCDFANSVISNVLCNDNETKSDPTDDYITFTMLAQYGSFTDTFSFKHLGSGYITPDFGKFGTESNFRLYNGSAGNGDVNLTFSYKKSYCLDTVVITDPGICSDCTEAPATINEFHYENEGSDSNEFIEVYIPNPQPENIKKYFIELYDGTTGTVYLKKTLDSMNISNDGAGSFYVLQFNGIKDGNPDGIALTGECGDIIEFLSYGGEFTAIDGKAKGMKSVNLIVNESDATPPNSSLQRIGNEWVYTIGYNTKGKVNNTGPCNILNAGISNILCNDNGTNYNPTDDYFTFKCNPIGNQLKGKYKLTSSKTKLTPEISDFGEDTVIKTDKNTAGKGNISIKLQSIDSVGCSIEFTIIDSGTCSPECNISVSNISAIKCNENSTNLNTNDDFLWFYLDPKGFNLSGKYLVEVNKGSITPLNADFGIKTYFNLQPGSAGGGDVELTIRDLNSSSCVYKNTIKDNGPCSPNAVIEPEIGYKVIIFPNPAEDVINLFTDNKDISAFRIFDIVGRNVKFGKMIEKLDISDLSDSVYTIMFYDKIGSLIEIQRFVKD